MASTIDARFKLDMTWEEKAQANPLYAVMSVPDFKARSGDPAEWSEEDIHAFFHMGKYIYDINVRPTLERLGTPRKGSYVFEYGSGMGRILKAVQADGYA